MVTNSMNLIEPHSCQHCENVFMPAPENHINGHEALVPSQSSELMRSLYKLDERNAGLMAQFIFPPRSQPRLLNIEPQRMERFIAEGCLFYKYISDGLRILRNEERRRAERGRPSPVLPIPEGIQISESDNQRYAVIRLDNYFRDIKIHLLFELLRFKSRQVHTQNRLLHNCVLGLNYETDGPRPENPKTLLNTTDQIELCLNRTRKWLEDCVQNHTVCSHHPQSFTPTRLIKICTIHGKRLIRLEEPTEPARYAALSYCWGGEQLIRTTKETLSRHRTRIDFEALPQTIKDAIIVTEKLELQYLWIDALCIVQDDDEDRSREIEQMGRVYDSADITITASGALGVQEGFLQNLLSSTYDKSAWSFKMRQPFSVEEAQMGIVSPRYFRPADDYLADRGWAFQERLFSGRILEFGSACVHWHCKTKNDCDRQIGKCTSEQLGSGNETLHGIQDYPQQRNLRLWYKLVEGFSARSLTVPRDRLPAIGGVAQRFGIVLEGQYLAGLWQSSLPQELLWSVGSDVNECYQPRSTSYLAPSWSWASTLQRIWTAKVHSSYHDAVKVEVIKATIENHVEGGTYGELTSGSLTLRGLIYPVSWDLPRTPAISDQGRIVTELPITGFIAIARDAMETELLAQFTGSMPVYLLEIVREYTQARGLILHKHPDGSYSRLGVFRSYPNKTLEGEFVEIGILQTITIV